MLVAYIVEDQDKLTIAQIVLLPSTRTQRLLHGQLVDMSRHLGVPFLPQDVEVVNKDGSPPVDTVLVTWRTSVSAAKSTFKACSERSPQSVETVIFSSNLPLAILVTPSRNCFVRAVNVDVFQICFKSDS